MQRSKVLKPGTVTNSDRDDAEELSLDRDKCNCDKNKPRQVEVEEWVQSPATQLDGNLYFMPMMVNPPMLTVPGFSMPTVPVFGFGTPVLVF